MTNLADNTWTPPTTGGTIDITTGGTVTEVYLDALVNNLRVLGGSTGTYSGKYTLGTPVAIPTSTWTPVNHDTDAWDPEGWHATAGAANANVIVPYAGQYQVKAHHYFTGNVIGYRSLRVMLNAVNSHYANGTAVGAAPTTIDVEDWLDVQSVPGTIQIQAWQDSGGTLNVAASGYLVVRRL